MFVNGYYHGGNRVVCFGTRITAAFSRRPAVAADAECYASGFDVDLNLTIREIEERDRKDATRTIAPLMVPSDAIFIDNTEKTLSDVADLMLKEIKNRTDYS
jgi:cytidylate kinase